jgi:hypothetical protein
MKKLLMFGTLAAMAVTLQAQEFPRITFNAGAGFTTPVGNTGNSLDTGWNVRGGVGYNFLPWVGANLDFGFDSMGVNSTTLSNLGYGGGTDRVFSATLDPIVHLFPKSPVDVYVTGGGGYFHEQEDFTDPGVGIGFFGNPLFSNVLVSSYSVNKPGLDIGAGVQFGSKWGGHFFAEARYVRIYSGSGFQADYVPATFGFRR